MLVENNMIHNLGIESDRRDSYVSTTPSANSSFSSAYSYTPSSGSWDHAMLSTPSNGSDRRSSCASFEYYDRSGSTSGTASVAGTPFSAVEGQDPFDAINSVTQSMLSDSIYLATPCSKAYPGQSMSDFGPYIDQMYSPYGAENLRNHQPSYPVSPVSHMQMYSSPAHDFVVPSQTCSIDEMYGVPSPNGPLGMFQSSPLSSSPYGPVPFMSPEPTPTRSSDGTWGPNMGRSVSPDDYTRSAHRALSHAMGVKGGRVRKSAKKVSIEGGVIERGQFKCKHPGCTSKPFKRQEHLKRHSNTHGNSREYPCKYCNKVFNRTDNLRQHTSLHAIPPNEKKSTRTEYFPEAAKEIAMEERALRRATKSSPHENDERRRYKRD
jgi:hypothetical protein